MEKKTSVHDEVCLFRAMTDGIPFIVWLQDANGEQHFVNRAFCEFFGVNRDEMLGQRWQALVHPEDKEAYVGEFLACVRERRPFRGQARVKRADGQWRWIESFGIPQFSDEGEFLGIVGSSPDITESKQAQEALLQTRSELERERNILRSIMNGAKNCHLAYLDRDFTFVRVNETYAATCGYAPAEMIGKNHFELYPHSENEAIFAQVRDTGIPAKFSDKPFSHHGQPQRGVTYWDWTLTPDKDDKGRVLGLVLALFETTERVKAEAALRSSEERLRLLGDNLPDSAVYQSLYNPNGEPKFLYMSAGVERIRGISAQDALRDANTLRRQIPPDYLKRVLFEEERSVSQLSDFDMDVPMRLPDGQERWIRIHSRPRRMQDGATIWEGVQTDITERRKAEEERERLLKEVEEQRARLQAVLDVLPVGVWVADANGRMTLVNRAAATIYGGEAPAIGKIEKYRVYQIWHPKTGKRIQVKDYPIVRALRGETVHEVELDHKRFDGSRGTHMASAAPIYDSQGALLGAVVAAMDISERTRAEAALRESEVRFKAVVDNSPVGICIWRGLDLVYELTNPAYRGLAPGKQFLGKTLAEVWPENIEPFTSLIRKVMTTGEPSSTTHGPVQIKRSPDGPPEDVYVNIMHVPLPPDASGRPRVLEITVDTTRQIRAQEDLERAVAERTNSLRKANQELELNTKQLRALAGELTMTEQRERKHLAKVLHDGLQQYLVAAKLQIGALIHPVNDTETNETAAEIDKLLSDAVKVSRTLAAELSPPILHEAGLLASLEWLARWKMGKYGLKVELQVQQMNAPVLEEDVKILLFQSVRELLLNVAKHAKTKQAWIHLSREGENIKIQVSDDGVGFDSTQDQLEAEHLGGFGLFSIRERIKSVGGKFEFESCPGKGSCFTLTAPLCPSALEGDSAVPEYRQGSFPPSTSEGVGKIRVMLTDDHAVMREGLARLLAQEKDFEVVGQASDGHQAVRMAASLKPDVLLMDVSMPGMNGIEATRIIHQQHPSIRIIGLSLYTASERAKEMLGAGAVFYLSKSGPPTDLKAAIRSCMKPKVGEGLTTSSTSETKR